jgi:hypothetical protein
VSNGKLNFPVYEFFFAKIVLDDTLAVGDYDVAQAHVLGRLIRIRNASGDPTHDDRVYGREML